MPALRLPIIGQSLGDTPLEAVLRDALEAAGAEINVERWERRPHQLADALTEVRGGGFAGALISAPHKERAAPLSDALNDDARTSGAVNVLYASDGRLRGDNTDLTGVRTGLEAILPKVQGMWPRHAVVLGAGGGARAVVAVLIGSGFQHVAVFNRHLHKAEALVTHFARVARHMELRARPWHEAIIEAELARSPLLVNASGVGADATQSPVPGSIMPPDRFVLDLVLTPEPTALMRDAEASGGVAANGQAAFLAGTAALVRGLTDHDASMEVLRSSLARELGLPEERLAVVGD